MKLIKKSTLLFLLAAPCGATFSGYTYQRTIVINANQVSTQALTYTNIPIVVSTNDISLSTAAGGHLRNASGFDIVFSTMSDCSFLLYWDTETINNTGTNMLNVWVNIPSISSTTNTTFYMCYGNSAITRYMGFSTKTWDNDYIGVWHLSTGTALSASDSTQYGLNGSTSGPTQGTGKIDGSAAYAATTDRITVSSTPTTNVFTWEAWVKNTDLGGERVICSFSDSFSARKELGTYSTGSGVLVLADRSSTTGNTEDKITTVNVSDGVLHHVAGTSNGTTTQTVYVDGINRAFSTGSLTNTGGQINLGNINGNNEGITGSIDEVRLSRIVRSYGWIETNYKNQSAPNTFETIGMETSSTHTFGISGAHVTINGKVSIQ